MSGDSQKKGSRVGLYTTISFHLAVLIVLLLVSINSVVSQETSFVLDFSKQEMIEQEQKEIELKEEVSKELDNLLSSPRTNIRNVAVDAGSKLRDDRFKNPNEVYDEARELQRKLDASKRDALAQDKADESVDLDSQTGKADEPARAYTGPSVLSYRLDGRKGSYLPVPAYKGYGSGDVAVAIVVNPKGRVIAAEVMTAISSSDPQLQEYALEAARRSRFSASDSAPAKQEGEIVYRFIGQ